MSLLRQALQKIWECTITVESRVSDVEDKVPPVAREAHVAHQLAKDTINRADDMENHLRRNNICIVGLPEKTEGRDPTTFVAGWLLEVFGKEAFPPFFIVERAHRTPGRPPKPGARLGPSVLVSYTIETGKRC